MYDKQVVRRRRAVLAVLVGLSIVLLTGYFGEGSGGFFHSIQSGAQTVLSPIEDGASRAFKPVRDLVGWFGDVFNAKDENKQLKKDLAAARSQGIHADVAPARQRPAPQAPEADGRPRLRELEPRDRARDREVADGLVLDGHDRQRQERRRPRGPARGQRRRPRRQGDRGDRRHGHRHADHRRLEQRSRPRSSRTARSAS